MLLARLTASVLAVFTLAPAYSLGAQKPLISQEALITVVENHKGAVLRYIDAAPDSMLGFRPTRGVRNFAEQIERAAGSLDHFPWTLGQTVPYLRLNGVTPPEYSPF